MTAAASRTPFAPPPGRPRQQVAVTMDGATRIFPDYRALRDAVFAEEQSLLDRWIAQAEARGYRRGRRATTLGMVAALCLPPLVVLLMTVLA